MEVTTRFQVGPFSELADCTLCVDSIVMREAEPLSTIVDNTSVILSVHAGLYFDFNGSATDIWSMIEEPRQVSSLLDELSQHYEVQWETMQRDVMSFLEAMIDARLIRVLRDGRDHIKTPGS